MNNLVDGFRNYLTIELGLSANAISAYVSDTLQLMSISENPPQIEPAHVDRFLAHLSRIGATQATMKRKLSSCRAFCVFLINCHGYPNDLLSRLPAVAKSHDAKKKYKHLTLEHLCGTLSKDDHENRVIIDLLLSTGIRVSELCQLNVEDINLADRTLKIMAKGRMERLIVFNDECREAIQDHLDATNLTIGPLLQDRNGQRHSRYAISRRLRSIGKSAGIGDLTPHMFRRHFASSLIRRQVPLEKIQGMLGHKTLAATQSYLLVDLRSLREVYRRCHPLARKNAACTSIT